jgi:hypothetical protein
MSNVMGYNEDDWNNAFTLDDGTQGPGARANITYSIVDDAEWLASLGTGTQFVFRPGKRYDLVLLTDSGWITQYWDALFMGTKDNRGNFTVAYHTSLPPIITNNLIVAARLSKT